MVEELLIAKEEYLSAGCHIGLAFKTKDMKKFIYKVRPNGMAVLNVSMLDKRIRNAANLIAKKENVLVASRKENAKKPVRLFAESIGARHVTGRFMPGSLTNPTYEHFFEPEIIIITDPYIDGQVIREAIQMRIPIISLADTSNLISYVDLVLPCNNKGKESIALVFFLLAREVSKLKGKEFKYEIKDFVPEEAEEERAAKEEDDGQWRRRPLSGQTDEEM